MYKAGDFTTLSVKKNPGVNFTAVKLLVREKNYSPLKDWSLFPD